VTTKHDAYLVRDRRVFPLSIGFGGLGLTSLCVCDLDGNGMSDLAFTYSWGSGIHRLHIAVMLMGRPTPIHREAPFVFRTYDLQLVRRGDRSVSVCIATRPHPTRLGDLTMRGRGRAALSVRLDPKLAPKWRSCIWRMRLPSGGWRRAGGSRSPSRPLVRRGGPATGW
jgi:hypothetical protein